MTAARTIAFLSAFGLFAVLALWPQPDPNGATCRALERECGRKGAEYVQARRLPAPSGAIGHAREHDLECYCTRE